MHSFDKRLMLAGLFAAGSFGRQSTSAANASISAPLLAKSVAAPDAVRQG